MAQTASHGPGAFRLRVGGEVLDGSAPALAALIKVANAAKRIDGLPDALNPDLIDPEKAAHFVAGLHRMGARTLAPLAGHELQLADFGLGIHYASPTIAASFDAPFTVKFEPGAGSVMFADTGVLPDAALAKQRAQEAERRYGGLSAPPGQDPAQAGEAILGRRQRQAVSVVWRLNAQAWADRLPKDTDASRSLGATIAAARASAIAPAGRTIPG